MRRLSDNGDTSDLIGSFRRSVGSATLDTQWTFPAVPPWHFQINRDLSVLDDGVLKSG